MARLLRGDEVASAVYAELRARLARLPFVPRLEVVRVGDDPASVAYVRLKARRARELGIQSRVHALPEDTSEEALLSLLQELNADPEVDGILVQLPLPPGIGVARVLEAIAPEKDVDGFHPLNVGRLWSQGPGAGLVPCTPAGVMRLLAHYEIPVAGRRAVVVGRSNIVGKPMAAMLLHADATVSLAHSKTQDLSALTREAELLVSAVGRPGYLKPEMVRPGAVVVDVGITRVGGRLLGDADPAVAEVASALTPVPGGVGPMTVAMLMQNTVEAAERRRGWTSTTA